MAQLSDPQDPLPEPSWRWRRLLTFAVVFGCLWLVSTVIERTENPEGIGYALIAFAALIVTYYTVAPSAEHVVKVLSAADLLKARLAKNVDQ